MSKFEKFFASNKVMITAFVIAIIGFAVMVVMLSTLIAADLTLIFNVAFAVIMFFLALSMYRSFAKHETNAMNIVTGAAIGILLIYNIQLAVIGLEIDVYHACVAVIDAVLLAILLINHAQINSIHSSVRGRIVLNQVILIAITAYQIYVIILNIAIWAITQDPGINFITNIVFALAKIFTFNMIICIETKLNAYRIDRDAAKADGTWTDEKKAETKVKYFGK